MQCLHIPVDCLTSGSEKPVCVLQSIGALFLYGGLECTFYRIEHGQFIEPHYRFGTVVSVKVGGGDFADQASRPCHGLALSKLFINRFGGMQVTAFKILPQQFIGDGKRGGVVLPGCFQAQQGGLRVAHCFQTGNVLQGQKCLIIRTGWQRDLEITAGGIEFKTRWWRAIGRHHDTRVRLYINTGLFSPVALE